MSAPSYWEVDSCSRLTILALLRMWEYLALEGFSRSIAAECAADSAVRYATRAAHEARLLYPDMALQSCIERHSTTEQDRAEQEAGA